MNSKYTCQRDKNDDNEHETINLHEEKRNCKQVPKIGRKYNCCTVYQSHNQLILINLILYLIYYNITYTIGHAKHVLLQDKTTIHVEQLNFLVKNVEEDTV